MFEALPLGMKVLTVGGYQGRKSQVLSEVCLKGSAPVNDSISCPYGQH